MKRKVLYALALLLFLSGVALSNERARYGCRTADSSPCSSSRATANPSSAAVAEGHVLLHTLIKLLYI